MSFGNKHSYGLSDNKSMEIKDIYGIDIADFRLFRNQTFDLGKNITVISGKNGTMKSTIMGLLAQPFRTQHFDVFGKAMQTKFSDVFKLSSEKDISDYLYYIRMSINESLNLKEPIPLYFQKGNPDSKYSKKDRHRLVPSGRDKGDGYFNLPSVYINLKRLDPLIQYDTIIEKKIEYTRDEKEFISKFYEKILLRTDFSEFENYEARSSNNSKNTKGPGNSYYDVQSISSGEDNLGYIVDTLISFNRIHADNINNTPVNKLTGILCIDEFEASLHPVAQMNLFNFLFDWSKEKNVKIIISTHSLYLIQQVMAKKVWIEHNRVVLNFIGSLFQEDNSLKVYKNPSYDLAYKELTLSEIENKENLLKIKFLCEDQVAIKLLKKVLGRKIQKISTFECSVDGIETGVGKQLLKQVCKNFPNLLNETRSIVIFDADVTEELNFRNFENFFIMESLFDLPFEKESIRYILSLNGDDSVFTNLKISKDELKQSFSRYNIPLDPNNINDESKAKYYKNWHNDNKNLSNKILTQYIRKNKQIFDEFKVQIENQINVILNLNGLPNL